MTATPRARPRLAPTWPSTLVQGLSNALHVPAMVTNAEGEVLSANDNFLFLYDLSEIAWEGQRLETLLPIEQGAVFEKALASTLGRSSAVEVLLPPLAGDLGLLLFTLTTRLVEGESRAVVFVLREVSVGIELTQLREGTEFKDFLYRALVHDLKSPLSAIINGVEFLRAIPIMDAEDQQDFREILAVVQSSVSHLQQLVEDFGEFAALRTQSPDAHEIRTLESIVEPIVEVYRLQGLPHRFEFEVDGRFWITAQERRLARAFDNLLSNAVKYSPEGGTVGVKIGPADHPGWVELTISDEGLGIAEEYHAKIWEPLYRQEHAPFSNIDGTGLGLSIVRHVIESHGGRLQLTSEVNLGSTFVIGLPTVEPPETRRGG